MQRWLVTMGLKIAIPHLHRKYFTEAISGPPAFTLAHHYAPSVFATYLSAASLISAVETLFDQEQQLSVRFLHFWFDSFSASVRRPVSYTFPFIPAPPRVAEDQIFNFDHGALNAGLVEETNYHGMVLKVKKITLYLPNK